MFGTKDPSQIGYFEANTAYGKTALRQAQRTDTHVHRLLAARIILDIGALQYFVEQDERLTGQTWERAKHRFTRISNEVDNVCYHLPEAENNEEALSEVAKVLVREDKTE